MSILTVLPTFVSPLAVLRASTTIPSFESEPFGIGLELKRKLVDIILLGSFLESLRHHAWGIQLSLQDRQSQ